MTPALSGISSMATRELLAELARAYEQQAGIRVQIQSVGGVDAARRVRAGERFDIVVLASGALAALEAEGHLVAGSRVDVARSGMAVAVAADAPRPSIADIEALKVAVLQARAIGYSTGPSGDHLMSLLQRWGLSKTVSSRLRRAPAGVPVGALLARGEVDLGFQQLSELIHAPGVEVLAPLPPEAQAVTVFSAAVGRASDRPAAARGLTDYLASPATADAKRRHGMDPAS